MYVHMYIKKNVFTTVLDVDERLMDELLDFLDTERQSDWWRISVLK